MKIMEKKLHFNLTHVCFCKSVIFNKKNKLLFFGLFYVSVHIHSVKNDIFHFCESAKN